MKLWNRQVNPYGLAVTVTTVTLGILGLFTGSLFLLNIFFWISTIIFWLLVVLVVQLIMVRRRRKLGTTRH